MELLNQRVIGVYEEQDRIAALLREASFDDQALQCHRWLESSLPKRYVFDRLYGDLLFDSEGLSVLDVGGGLTGLTRRLHERHDYTLLDILVHDSEEAIVRVERSLSAPKFVKSDWYDFLYDRRYDVVIANDIFPNVDQRVEAFIRKFLPCSERIRLSLTYYNSLRFYKTKRVDADEVFYVQAWTGEMTLNVLNQYANMIDNFHASIFSNDEPSVYKNGRQVCLATLYSE